MVAIQVSTVSAPQITQAGSATGGNGIRVSSSLPPVGDSDPHPIISPDTVLSPSEKPVWTTYKPGVNTVRLGITSSASRKSSKASIYPDTQAMTPVDNVDPFLDTAPIADFQNATTNNAKSNLTAAPSTAISSDMDEIGRLSPVGRAF